jgi:hypothetical protein
LQRITLVFLATLALSGSAAASASEPTPELRSGPVRGAVDSWCTKGRSVCTAVAREYGVLVGAIATRRDVSRHYRVCLLNPDRKLRCVGLKLSKPHDGVAADAFHLDREFPIGKSGAYALTWFMDGKQVGPRLSFNAG